MSLSLWIFMSTWGATYRVKCVHGSLCACVLEIYHGRSCPSSLNMFTCIILSVLMQSTFLSSPRCSGCEAALRSEQTRGHGCGWGREYEWVGSDFLICPSVCPCSCLCGTFKCLLVLLFPFFLSACVSSLLRPSVFLCCVISVDTVWLLT